MHDQDVLENLEIARGLYKKETSCENCDLSVGHLCEDCFITSTISQAINEIKNLRKELENWTTKKKCAKCGKFYEITGVGWSGCYYDCKECFMKWRDALTYSPEDE